MGKSCSSASDAVDLRGGRLVVRGVDRIVGLNSGNKLSLALSAAVRPEEDRAAASGMAGKPA